MSNSRFPAHGSMRLSIQGQLLIVEGSGPGNIEMVQEYQQQVVGLRKQIMHAPWVSLALLSGTPLVSPEAKELFIQVVKQAKSMNLRATAVVFIEMESADLVRQFWREIYTSAGLKFSFFDTENEARDWLQSVLENDSNTDIEQSSSDVRH
ncbi:hypothetical protein [Paraglaciecola arctica]|uniref:hypothetical protein n=1 Tax=Paraglaciecola arctica TaxID=1128911 RepID=UPI001C07A61B|nr:hypothetical protein [Paraglaciecola arctica]MBU3002397.1 hypothetical protein [Paraglaciecola arctica]